MVAVLVPTAVGLNSTIKVNDPPLTMVVADGCVVTVKSPTETETIGVPVKLSASEPIDIHIHLP